METQVSTRRELHDAGSTEPGWHCISVAPETEGQYEFTYTSGVWRALHHPEVSIFGLSSAIAVDVLGSVVSRIRDGSKFEEGHLIQDVLQGGFTLKVAGLASRESYDEYFGEGMRQAGGDVPVLVLLWPNKRGEFPKPGEAHPQVEAFQVMQGA
ncbi:MAG TPA: DUF4262 domain-containing protein [Xanthomonadaceae bacterium]